MEGLSIIHLDDNPADQELIRIEVEKGFPDVKLIQAKNKEEFESAMNRMEPDIFILDHRLPGFQEYEAIEMARKKYPDADVILLSGTIKENKGIEALHQGAEEYVFKDHLNKLNISIERLIGKQTSEEEKKEFAEIIDLSDSAILILDARTHKVKFANQGAENALGYSKTELYQLGISKICTDLILEQRIKALEDDKSDHSSQSFECQIVRRDESTYPANIRAQYIKKRNPAILLNIIDITEKKRDEIAIKELAQFPEENPNPVFRIGRDLKVSYMNASGAELYPHLIDIHGQLINDIKTVVRRSIENLQHLEKTIRIRNRFFQLNINPTENTGSAYIYAKDITAEKRIQILNESTLRTLGALTTQSLNAYTIFSTIHQGINRALHAPNLCVVLHDKTTGKTESQIHITKEAINNPLCSTQDQEFLSSFLDKFRRDNAIIQGDQAKMREILGESDSFDSQDLPVTWVSIPLDIDDIQYGVILIYSSESQELYDENDIQFFQMMTDQLKSILIRRKNLRRLKFSEEKYRLLFEKNLAGVYRVSASGRILECNDAYASILGFNSKDKVMGKMISEILPNSNIDRYVEEITDEGGSMEGVEYELELKNGKKIWTIENSALVRNEEGDPMYIQGTVIDVTKQKEYASEIEEEKKQALRYQLKLLSSQLNPHFIYNALNSVSYYIMDKNVEDAINYVSDFSKLMRIVLNNSNHEHITLVDELTFLDHYLNIERERHDGKFDYKIEVADDINLNTALIPPMILQPYIENSIVHGLRNKTGKGHLKIGFKKENHNLCCMIEDDGIGRNAALKLQALRRSDKDGKPHGMGIIESRLRIMRELGYGIFNSEVEDITDENGEPSGTRVYIHMPWNEID